MKIHIEDLEISCIIGILDFEREAEQKVVVDLVIEYAYKKGLFLNYASIVDLIEGDLKNKKHELLEESLISIQKSLFAAFPEIEKMELKISKPDILNNCTVALSEKWINTPQ